MTPLKVKVYRNIRRHDYSVVAAEGPNRGRVIHHAVVVVLSGVTFAVNEARRQRVIATGRKNVHAYVVGTLDYAGDVNGAPTRGPTAERIVYNPRKAPTFVLEHAPSWAVTSAKRVVLEPLFCWAEQ